MAAAAHVAATGEIGEFPTGRRGDEHLAGIRVAKRRLGADATVREAIEEREIFVAAVPRDERAVLEEDSDVDRRFLVERSRECARIAAVDHRSTVRRGHQRPVETQTRNALDPRLAVIRAEHDRVALEKRLPAARRFDEGGDSRVCAAERIVCRIRAERMRGVVVVREVEDEQVERVARHEPAPHLTGVGVDRASGTIPPRHRRAGPVRLVDAVEEEVLRPVHRRQARYGRHMPRAATVGRDVDRGRRQASVLERLVDGDGARQ